MHDIDQADRRLQKQLLSEKELAKEHEAAYVEQTRSPPLPVAFEIPVELEADLPVINKYEDDE